MDESLKRLYGEETNLKSAITELSSIVRKNNHLAKDIFKSVLEVQGCMENTYNSLTQRELVTLHEFIEPNPTPFDPSRQYHLGSMCSTLSKYLENIDVMKETKGGYKKEIMDLVRRMYIQVEHIVNQDQDNDLNRIQKPKSGSDTGSGTGMGMHHIQLDDIVQLRKSISEEYSSSSCRGIKEINRAIKQYYKIIMDKLDTYIKLIKTKTINSPDFTKIIYQIRVYRILYHRLLLFVKHYKRIRKELLITCGEDEKNRRYLVQCLSNMENVMKIESPMS